jgi:hypothetical protein
MIYQAHIIAQYENMFDIADIYGYRMGGQDFFYPLDNCTNSSKNPGIIAQMNLIQFDNKSFVTINLHFQFTVMTLKGFEKELKLEGDSRMMNRFHDGLAKM